MNRCILHNGIGDLPRTENNPEQVKIQQQEKGQEREKKPERETGHERVKIRAQAKINLGLDVIGRRADGYHEVSMIMQSLELCDHIELIKTEDESIRLEITDRRGNGSAGIPADGRNLMVRAAGLMRDRFGWTGGLVMKLEKHIPSEAGMGGGSADAAAVITGINSLFRLGIPKEELMKAGAQLGADIPFCIMGGTARAEGIGDILTPVTALHTGHVLVIKPVMGMSTPEVYRAYDSAERNGVSIRHPDIDSLEKALAAGDCSGMYGNMGNVLEYAVIPEVPLIGMIKEELIASGAVHSMMTGSGSAVFGLFGSADIMHEAAELFASGPYADRLSDIIETGYAVRSDVQ